MNENNQLVPLNKDILKTVLAEQLLQFKEKDPGIEREQLNTIKKYLNTPHAIVVSGLRRVGKSTLLAQIAQRFYKDKYYFVNFEDERLVNFQAHDFNSLFEILIELFGEKKVFIFDEIQNVAGWERFVRRMIDDNFKFYLTGSNASLLSRELGSRLTGRYLPLELLPFSFQEFLEYKKIPKPDSLLLTTKQKGRWKKEFNEYLVKGGIPDALKYPSLDWHNTLYNDVIYRDVAGRYQINEMKALKELTFYLFSNISNPVSYNKMKELLGLGSVNTIKSYIDYLEAAWLLFPVNCFAYSVKKQQIAAKKVYGIDTGLIKSVAFAFSPKTGNLLENLVYLTLRRKNQEIYYYKTDQAREVDFYIPRSKTLIQVCQSMENEETREREIQALVEAMKELEIKSGLILTQDEEEVIKEGKQEIEIKPVFKWLLDILQ